MIDIICRLYLSPTAAAFYLYIIFVPIGIRFFFKSTTAQRETTDYLSVVLDDRIAYTILYTHHYAWCISI